MNLELVEHRCLKHLEQAASPLVPLRTLLAHVWQDEQSAGVTEQDLLTFLSKHELVHVIEAEKDRDPEEAEAMAEAGLSRGPYVILKTRIPTKAEMAQLIQAQLEKMIDALEGALGEAVKSGDEENQRRVRELIDRSQEFQKKLGEAFE